MLHLVADENIPAIELVLGHSIRVTRCNGRSLQREQLQDADLLFVRSVTQVNRELLEETPVQFVGTATSGTEHVDVDWLQQQGIGFSRAAGSNANSVAEYVLSALAVSGDWLEKVMAGASVGIVGYGPVGQAVDKLLGALGGRCAIYDPWLEQSELPGNAPLDQILASDLICLHPELSQRQPWPSFHLIGSEELNSLNSQQMLLNASRGAVVDNDALAQRLAQADAPQVVLDVWEGEPKLSTALLAQVGLGTAHIAGYSLDGKILATSLLCEALVQAGHVSGVSSGNEFYGSSQLIVESQWCGAELVRQLILQCYDIRDDDRRLRAACGEGVAIGTAFDHLRKHYPERRELAGSNVRASSISASSAELIRRLGCRVL